MAVSILTTFVFSRFILSYSSKYHENVHTRVFGVTDHESAIRKLKFNMADQLTKILEFEDKKIQLYSM